MSDFLHDKVLLYAFPVFILFLLLELWIDRKEKKDLYDYPEMMGSLAMSFGAAIIGLSMKFLALLFFIWLSQFALFPELNWQWWVWIIAFFADDFTFYVHHRTSHEVRILWAAHVNHHSALKMNFGTALRQSWTEQLYKYVFWIWMPLIGFEPLMIMILMSANLVFQFFPHTQLVGRLPKFIEWVFNTPSHHRVHHASNHLYLDRNHAGVLIIWDRIFGSFQAEKDDVQPVYGITNNIHTNNPFVIASHGFAEMFKDIKSTNRFSEKLKYIFGPPGWSHEGNDQRAKTLRLLARTKGNKA